MSIVIDFIVFTLGITSGVWSAQYLWDLTIQARLRRATQGIAEALENCRDIMSETESES